MSEACHFLHETLWNKPRYKAADISDVPSNGLYFLFEEGELGHGNERIVRVGTHTGQNNLAKRIREHLYTPNKDRSIFRKHIGRCILNQRLDPLIEQWEIDLTTRKAREKNENIIDREIIAKIETEVTQYMNTKFSFTVLNINEKEDRLSLEQKFLGTIFSCPRCGPSSTWLGKHHPHSIIREGGLWNVQGLNGPSLTIEEINAVTE